MCTQSLYKAFQEKQMEDTKSMFPGFLDRKDGPLRYRIPLRKEWTKWTKQLQNVTVPSTIVKNMTKADAVHLRAFTDASNLACCTAATAVTEHSSAMIKGLLTSRLRISKRDTSIARLELISGQMAVNLAKNIHNAL